jgi:transcriptional antiterminator RfaH
MTQSVLQTPFPLSRGTHVADTLRSVLSWFLVFTKPAGEETARVNLERQGYRTYYPRLLRHCLRRGCWVEQVVSLFPRYLFVQVDTALQSLAPVHSTVGVTNVVRFGSESTVVPDAVVATLIGREDPQSGLHRLGEPRPLIPGSRVSIVAGAFEGLDGIFERDDGGERVIVLLKLLGRKTPVRMPAGFVMSGSIR